MTACIARIDIGAPEPSLLGGVFGFIGMTLIGRSLTIKAADHGFTVVVVHRTVFKLSQFLENEAKGVSCR